MMELRAQAERFGAQLVTDDVIALTGQIKKVTAADGDQGLVKVDLTVM